MYYEDYLYLLADKEYLENLINPSDFDLIQLECCNKQIKYLEENYNFPIDNPAYL